MKKYFYLRIGTVANTEVNEDTGSVIYPVENFHGAVAGQYGFSGTGSDSSDDVIIDDDNMISIFMKPYRKTQTAEAGVADADIDVLLVSCGQYQQKTVIKNLLNKVNSSPKEKDNCFITLLDRYVNKAAGEVTSDIGATSIEIKRMQKAAD